MVKLHKKLVGKFYNLFGPLGLIKRPLRSSRRVAAKLRLCCIENKSNRKAKQHKPKSSGSIKMSHPKIIRNADKYEKYVYKTEMPFSYTYFSNDR